jgi:hypothetical protein
MHRTLATLTAVLFSTLACASSSTSLTGTWRAPEMRRLPFRRALTSFVSTDVGMRRAVEDRLATRIPGSFPSYSAVPELSLSDAEKAREQLRGKLFDGAVVVRIVEARNGPAARPDADWSTTYPGFYDYWESSWTTVRNSAQATETTSPRSVKEVMDHSVDAAVRELWAKQMIR